MLEVLIATGVLLVWLSCYGVNASLINKYKERRGLKMLRSIAATDFPKFYMRRSVLRNNRDTSSSNKEGVHSSHHVHIRFGDILEMSRR